MLHYHGLLLICKALSRLIPEKVSSVYITLVSPAILFCMNWNIPCDRRLTVQIHFARPVITTIPLFFLTLLTITLAHLSAGMALIRAGSSRAFSSTPLKYVLEISPVSIRPGHMVVTPILWNESSALRHSPSATRAAFDEA